MPRTHTIRTQRSNLRSWPTRRLNLALRHRSSRGNPHLFADPPANFAPSVAGQPAPDYPAQHLSRQSVVPCSTDPPPSLPPRSNSGEPRSRKTSRVSPSTPSTSAAATASSSRPSSSPRLRQHAPPQPTAPSPRPLRRTAHGPPQPSSSPTMPPNSPHWSQQRPRARPHSSGSIPRFATSTSPTRSQTCSPSPASPCSARRAQTAPSSHPSPIA